jgi:hypothetical protein
MSRVGVTRGFLTGLRMGRGTGTTILTRQQPVPVAIPVTRFNLINIRPSGLQTVHKKMNKKILTLFSDPPWQNKSPRRQPPLLK